MKTKTYQPSPAVQAEIHQIQGLPQTEWDAKLKHARNETLVFMIRHVDRADQQLYGGIVQELRRRILHQARRSLRGVDSLVTEEILLNVEIDILETLLTPNPSRQTDFLQIAFAKVIQGKTVNALEKQRNSVLGHRGEFIVDAAEDADDVEEMGGPLALVADTRPNPEEALLQLEEQNERHRLLRKALRAVKDPRLRKAVILHYGHDWCVDRLAKHFNVTRGQMNHWIATAMAAMREACGVGTK
jgi:DNA-directed RNA polymerase specialized sigma24 family protein